MVDKIRLKVFVNSRTGQGVVLLPKKKFGFVPKFIDVERVRRRRGGLNG